MTIPGETLTTGAIALCPDCGVDAFERLGVYSSGAGAYIGSFCDCGPYSRESIYIDATRAQEVFDQFRGRLLAARRAALFVALQDAGILRG